MRTIKMRRAEVRDAYKGIAEILKANQKHPHEFTYFLSRNRRYLEPTVQAIQETEETLLKDFRAKVKPFVEPASGVILNAAEYEKVEKEFEPILKDHKEFLRVEVEIDSYGFPADKMPDEVPALFADWIFPLLTEPSPAAEASKKSSAVPIEDVVTAE